MLHQIARPPWAKGFLIRNGGQRELALQLIADAVKIGKCEDRSGSAAFHVRHPAPPDFVIHDGPTPRAAIGPSLVLTDRETVDVPIEYEMFTRPSTFKTGNDIGKCRIRVNDAIGNIGGIQKRRNMSGRLPRISGRVRAFCLYELTEKGDEPIVVAVDPIHELTLGVVHKRLPSSTERNECGEGTLRQINIPSG